MGVVENRASDLCQRFLVVFGEEILLFVSISSSDEKILD